MLGIGENWEGWFCFIRTPPTRLLKPGCAEPCFDRQSPQGPRPPGAPGLASQPCSQVINSPGERSRASTGQPGSPSPLLARPWKQSHSLLEVGNGAAFWLGQACSEPVLGSQQCSPPPPPSPWAWGAEALPDLGEGAGFSISPRT